ncbi:MAG: thioredoxin family protein [Planctomycetes bacterium]|nr:thioredoxin family protein [Planctomycetota bacterium]
MIETPRAESGVKPTPSSKGWMLALIAVTIGAYAVLQKPPHTSIEWSDDFAAARLAAQQQGGAVLLEFTATGCRYCSQMAREVLARPDVERELTRFFPVRVNWRNEQALADRYGVEAVPTFVVLNDTGQPVGKLVGYQPAEEFKAFLQRVGPGALDVRRGRIQGAPDR